MRHFPDTFGGTRVVHIRESGGSQKMAVHLAAFSFGRHETSGSAIRRYGPVSSEFFVARSASM